MKGKIILICISIIAICATICVLCLTIFNHNVNKSTSVDIIMEKIESVSELTTAKMICTGLEKYTDGKIPFLNQEAFSMTYSATVSAGIKLEEVNVDVGITQVTITVPPISILNIDVDDDSIQFYDNKFALFKNDSKDDVIEARKKVKQTISERSDIDQLKLQAKEQIEVLLNGMLKDNIGERKLVVVFEEPSTNQPS